MKLIIDKDRKVYSAGTWGTVNENDYEILDFEFPEELEEYNKRIVYYLGDERVWDTIVNNKAYITNAITTKGDVKAYVWCTKENTEREADTDFRTMLFEMHFYENENADGIVPTPEQVDGFNTMLTAMNAKIDEVDALEQTIETAEAERQEAEATRVLNENTRESNESTRQTNEQTRQTQEADRERRTDEAIADIEDKTAEYNANAEAKTTAFNNNATQKTNEFNSNYTQKVNDFNTNATSKTNDFNSNASSKTTTFNDNAASKTNTFNSNASSKTTDFNTNAENKTSAFNTNASDKTTAFDNNASSKTTTFNENATSKTNDFNDNATQKTTDFNNNAQAKTDAFDEHTAEITADIEDLQQEVNNNSENIDYIVPKNISISDESVNFIDDAIDYKIFEIEIEGNSSQNGTPTVDSPVEKDVVKGEILLAKSGAQLFDIDTITRGKFMNVDGTYTNNVNSFYSDYIPVLPSTTIKLINASSNTRVIEFDENKEYVTGAMYATGTIRTIQLNNNTHYIVVSDNTNNDTYKGMVVYSEYMNLIDDVYTGNTINKISLGNNLLNKLSTYDTDIVKIDKEGEVILNKNIERLIITGNEAITMKSDTYTNPDSSVNHVFAIPVPANRRMRTQRYVESNFGYYQKDIRVVQYNNNVVEFNESFLIATNQYQTLEEFVAWVKEMYENGTPLYIDYMITPIQIDLGNIEKLSTTEGYNYVKTATNIETNTNVKYALDIKKYADKKLDNLDSRLALLE